MGVLPGGPGLSTGLFPESVVDVTAGAMGCVIRVRGREPGDAGPPEAEKVWGRSSPEPAEGASQTAVGLGCSELWERQGVRCAQESSPAPEFKSINSLVLNFLYSPTLISVHDHWKNYSFD